MPAPADTEERIAAWVNGMRTAKAAGAFDDVESREERQDREIADLKRQYVRDEIDLFTFETWVARVLAGR